MSRCIYDTGDQAPLIMLAEFMVLYEFYSM